MPIIAGLSFSNIAMAIQRKVAARKVFMVSGNAGPSPLAGAACSPYFFSAAKQNDQFAEASGSYAKQKGYSKVIALAPNYQAGKDFIAGFKRNFGSPLEEEMYTQLTQLDFSAEISRVTAARPDAVYAFYPGRMGSLSSRPGSRQDCLARSPY